LRLNCGDTFFTEEVAGAQQGNGCFFAALGDHGKLDLALLDIKHRIGGIALGKDGLAFFKVEDGPAKAGLGEKGRRSKNQFLTTRCAERFHCL
jgi:hypothetical protein